MSEKAGEVTNGEVTVVWKKDLCIHSANCVNGLPLVFQPKERRWIQLEHATSQQIIEQVSKCPSGALSIKEKTEGMSEERTTVDVAKNGPLLVKGNIEVCHPDGRKEMKEKVTAFCRCGASSNKPYCDGTHKNNGFTHP